MLTCGTLILGLSLGSYHLDRAAGLQEFNPGAYIACDRWTGGVYKNSFGRPSIFVGYILPLGPVDITLGFVTGYEKRIIYEGPARDSERARGCSTYCYVWEGSGGKISPIILPSIRLGNVRVGIIPPLAPKQKGAVTFGVEW